MGEAGLQRVFKIHRGAEPQAGFVAVAQQPVGPAQR